MENRRPTSSKSFDRNSQSGIRTRSGSQPRRSSGRSGLNPVDAVRGSRNPNPGRGNGYRSQRSADGYRNDLHRPTTSNEAAPARKRTAGKLKHDQWEQAARIKLTSDLQLTDGKHRGKLLANSVSARHVPTARKLREIVFKILSRRIRAGRFLDLCAGCGMLGLEAISRGAMAATFVERSARMASLIKKNLDSCGIKPGHGEIVEAEIVPFLKQMEKRRRFWDVVYYGAPDDADHQDALRFLNRGVAVARGGVLVIEHNKELFFPEKLGILDRGRVMVIDDRAVSLYERK